MIQEVIEKAIPEIIYVPSIPSIPKLPMVPEVIEIETVPSVPSIPKLPVVLDVPSKPAPTFTRRVSLDQIKKLNYGLG
jgi:hypothetical protein